MSVLTALASALLTVALTLLLVDFVSGLVHWAEDTFWTEHTPVVGRWIVQPNVLHHHDGAAFVRHSWWHSSWDLALAAGAVVAAAWALGLLSWPVWLWAVVGANANQIHKWNHQPASRLPPAVRLLQRLRLLQATPDHARHHRGDKNTAYCVVTPWLNPVLDRTGFWRGLEHCVTPWYTPTRREDLLGG